MSGISMYKARDWDRQIKPADIKISDDYRSPFRRDYARLIHSPAFRRLQGKTQLFPGNDSDFFRNRLTHSIEVAQIAKTIALKLNLTTFKTSALDLDLVELAGLAHDLGHPPFGHNGEYALDACMKDCGGFEGNAQTLRILSRLEKKIRVSRESSSFTTDDDSRAGLNLCYRSLAAVLKYDRVIPQSRGPSAKLAKGYYGSEKRLVEAIRENVLDGYYLSPETEFRTIECDIMDIADDIAYSTYDLEDSLKAGFVSPLDFISPPQDVIKHVGFEVTKTLQRVEGDTCNFTVGNVLETLSRFAPQHNKLPGTEEDLLKRDRELLLKSKSLQDDGYVRSALTSELVERFVNGVDANLNPACPPLSRIKVNPEVLREIETLKHFNFSFTIMSPRVQLTAYRGFEIVNTIFKALMDDSRNGNKLLPEDVRDLWKMAEDNRTKARVVCDFVAGMTDHYAVDFYARLKSENARTIFKPH